MDSPKSLRDEVIQYHTVADRGTAPLSADYTLKRFSWRSFLGIVGPLLLLAFYSFICFHYLNRPPQNDVVLDIYLDAIVPFYLWLVVSVFALDWARTALANFQAAVLMRPNSAIPDGMHLFWHADDNWANPLWWLRALRNLVFLFVWGKRQLRRQTGYSERYTSLPGFFWGLLSAISLLVFMAIPLSGLTMELRQISTPGGEKALILGPKDTTFNMKGFIDLPAYIYPMWLTGGVATPSDASFFYAPQGTENVSAIYFEEQSSAGSGSSLTTFLGPAIDYDVSGESLGLESEVECSQVAAEDFKLIVFHDFGNYTAASGAFMQLYDETGFWEGVNAYSLVVAAEGISNGNSAYDDVSNIDPQLYNYRMNITEPGKIPAAYFEMFLWQGITKYRSDPILESLFEDQSPLLKKTVANVKYQNGWHMTDVVGFGIQCQIRSAYGKARVYPNTRTYESFELRNVTPWGADYDVYAPQVLAVQALGNYDIVNYRWRPRDPEKTASNWMAMHLAINEPAKELCEPYTPNCQAAFAIDGRYSYPTLTPQNVTLAIHRLIGKSLISMMGAGSQEPWPGDLYLLKSARWLVPGPVPWKVVLAILALWTTVVVSTSVWTLFTKRWAPVLCGFELFRFGAQYTEAVDKMQASRFEECQELHNVPGMVGVLPGDSGNGNFGFIGLSECVAAQDGQYVYSRSNAAKYRNM